MDYDPPYNYKDYQSMQPYTIEELNSFPDLIKVKYKSCERIKDEAKTLFNKLSNKLVKELKHNKKKMSFKDNEIDKSEQTEISLFDHQTRKTYFYDFVNLNNNTIIEYNGEHVHPNLFYLIGTYQLDSWRHAYTKETAEEVYLRESRKRQVAIDHGYKIISIFQYHNEDELEYALMKAFMFQKYPDRMFKQESILEEFVAKFINTKETIDKFQLIEEYKIDSTKLIESNGYIDVKAEFYKKFPNNKLHRSNKVDEFIVRQAEIMNDMLHNNYGNMKKTESETQAKIKFMKQIDKSHAKVFKNSHAAPSARNFRRLRKKQY